MSSYSRESIINRYYQVEGGKVDHKDDLGGLTGAGGITWKLLKKHEDIWDIHGFDGNIDEIPLALYHSIMCLEFWDPMSLSEIHRVSPKLADCMYGWAINSGPLAPCLTLQKHLNVFNLKGNRYEELIVDGIIGSKTIAALKQYRRAMTGKKPIEKLLDTIISYQRVHYVEISLKREANESFTDGWFNRVAHKAKRLKED